MIPKYLKIKGLYSYQTEQEIDFDPLTEASLFGIFGSVGSGKSSILEAITFALYGDTERLNKSGDDRTYNMMNLRSDDLLIDFECIAGKNGDRYRFTVRGKRNSKNFKDVKTFERKAYIWQDDAWVPLSENQSTESIIGLSYDNFRRTIIIPQGRFQEFIELKDAERTRMMKELFQLEKYDLSRNVGSLSKQNDLALSNVDGQLMGLGEVTLEMVEAEEKTRDAVRLEIKKINDELIVQTELESQFQKLKLTAEKIQLLKTQLQSLEAQRPAMQLREEILRTFEICSLHFKSLLDQKSNLSGNIGRDQKMYEANRVRTAEMTIILEKQKEVLLQLKSQYEKREELLDTADELEKVIRILENTAALVKRKEALLRGEEQLKEKEKNIVLLKKQRLDRETENELRKNQISDIQEISLVKSWFNTLDALTESRLLVKNEAESLQAEIVRQHEGLKEKLAEIVALTSLDLTETPTQESFQNVVAEFLGNREAQQRTLNKQLLQINTKLALHQYAGDLENGEPCPLCGSEHHPAILHSDHGLSAEILTLEKQIIALEDQEKKMRQLQSPIEKIFNQIENLEKQKVAIRERFAEAKSRLELHQAGFIWPKFDKSDREGFDKHFAEVNKNQAEIKEMEAAIKLLTSRIEADILERTEKIEKPLQNLRDEMLRLENTVLTLAEQLMKVNPADFEGQEKPAIAKKIDELKLRYRQITDQFEQAEKQIDILEKEKHTLSGSQTTLLVALENGKKDLLGVQAKIEEQLNKYTFESETQVNGILAKPIQIDMERKAIDEYKFALETTGRDLQNVLNENPEQLYDIAKHQEVTKAKELLAGTLHNQRKEEGRLDGLLKKMAEDLAKKALLLKDKGRLELRREHLGELAKLFRSSGFVDYASSIYLQNLIQAANHRFHQMTHQQLHLELGEGNSFWVRDLLNGGHMRLLKTLSGGQKFQAALSLALALADHIHVRNESKHNFFFLDEGFGSLDKNALQTVFETLKSLRKENRIVGIISHVEDLQQEIQTYLSIKESEEGSRIVASWK
ncbi:MAG: SMC family ATPase [Dyadobacter sp.]|uniref:SMC family ATPase n=1 Tax=Dyadobacter sp. TaxID=1914288 RepID=UPI003266571F